MKSSESRVSQSYQEILFELYQEIDGNFSKQSYFFQALGHYIQKYKRRNKSCLPDAKSDCRSKNSQEKEFTTLDDSSCDFFSMKNFLHNVICSMKCLSNESKLLPVPKRVCLSNWNRYLQDFDELGPLGEGGFGRVFKVRHRLDNREYAVKKIQLRFSKPSELELLLREVYLLSTLSHPNVSRYYSSWIQLDEVTHESRWSGEDLDISLDGDNDWRSDNSYRLSNHQWNEFSNLSSLNAASKESSHILFESRSPTYKKSSFYSEKYSSNSVTDICQHSSVLNSENEILDFRSKNSNSRFSLVVDRAESQASEHTNQVFQKVLLEKSQVSQSLENFTKDCFGELKASRFGNVSSVPDSNSRSLKSDSKKHVIDMYSKRYNCDCFKSCKSNGSKSYNSDCSEIHKKSNSSKSLQSNCTESCKLGRSKNIKSKGSKSCLSDCSESLKSVSFESLTSASSKSSECDFCINDYTNSNFSDSREQIQCSELNVVALTSNDQQLQCPIVSRIPTLYIQMQLGGESLSKWLQRRNDRFKTQKPPWTDDEIEVHSRIFKGILSALQYIHAKNIIHRDVKPMNILVSSDGQDVLLGDFGLAKLLSSFFGLAEKRSSKDVYWTSPGSDASLNHSSSVIGTPTYSAPEIMKNKSYDNKADIYSLGIILLEMMHPFQSMSERAKVIGSFKKTRTLDSSFVSKWGTYYSLLIAMTDCDPLRRPSSSQILRQLNSRQNNFTTTSQSNNGFVRVSSGTNRNASTELGTTNRSASETHLKSTESLVDRSKDSKVQARKPRSRKSSLRQSQSEVAIQTYCNRDDKASLRQSQKLKSLAGTNQQSRSSSKPVYLTRQFSFSSNSSRSDYEIKKLKKQNRFLKNKITKLQREISSNSH